MPQVSGILPRPTLHDLDPLPQPHAPNDAPDKHAEAGGELPVDAVAAVGGEHPKGVLDEGSGGEQGGVGGGGGEGGGVLLSEGLVGFLYGFSGLFLAAKPVCRWGGGG